MSCVLLCNLGTAIAQVRLTTPALLAWPGLDIFLTHHLPGFYDPLYAHYYQI